DNFRHTIRAAMIDAAMSPHYGIAVPSGTSFWERERQRIIRAWSAGEMRSCTHNPSPGAPQPVYVFLWRPDLIVCQRCTMIANALSEIEDRTCDGCGRVVAGTADDPMYTPTAVWRSETFGVRRSLRLGELCGCREGRLDDFVSVLAHDGATLDVGAPAPVRHILHGLDGDPVLGRKRAGTDVSAGHGNTDVKNVRVGQQCQFLSRAWRACHEKIL